jgi:hypothetical protein
MPGHVADPYHVVVRVDGTAVSISRSQTTVLRAFDLNGELRDEWPDLFTLRTLARRGWVLRTRGHFMLTPRGRAAHAAVVAYFARKADALG